MEMAGTEIYPEELSASSPFWNETKKKWERPKSYLQFRPYEYGYSFPKTMYYIIYMAAWLITGRWHCCTVAQMLEDEGAEVYDRLMGVWATVAIVASLLLSFTFPLFATKLDNPNNVMIGGMDGSEVVGLLSFISMTMFIIAIIGVIIMSMALMTIPKECAAEFVKEFSYFISLPEANAIGGLLVFLVNTVVCGMIIYGETFSRYLVIIITVSGFYCVMLLISTVATLDRRGGLWEYGYYVKHKKKIADGAM